MKLTRIIAIAVIAASWGTGYVQAQSSDTSVIPAEFPPASYAGRQYVDSKGCVFIRAGIDGNVTWVPRVTRSRQVICGFQPSLPQLARADEPPAAAAAVETKKVRKVVAKPKAKKVVKPRTVVKAQPVRTVPAAVAAAAPATAKPAKPVKKVKKVRKVARAAPACRGASAISQQYIGTGSGVRCGPQSTPHVFYTNRIDDAKPVRVAVPTQSVTPESVLPGQYVVKRRIYRSQAESVAGVYVPQGYKPVWTDGRLNPYRTRQTFAGQAQMDVIWTKTVPRYLIDRKSGREVTYHFPGLQYPYTSYAEQRAAGVAVMTRGIMVPDPVVLRDGQPVLSTRSHPQAVAQAKPDAVAAQKKTVSVTLSTQSSVPKAPAKAASHRYVQVGHFTTEVKARAAAVLLANAGLPARMGKSKGYFIVVAGPYQTQPALQGALTAVRRVGYTGATLRK